MLNPEKAQRCLEAMVHNIFKWVSSDKMCSSFAVCCLLIIISQTENISENGSIYFGGQEHYLNILVRYKRVIASGGFHHITVEPHYCIFSFCF